MLENMKKNVSKLIAIGIYKEAEKNANSACAFIHGQPKMPEKVKNLRKEK